MSKNRKQQIVDFVRKYVKENGSFPILDEIKNGVGLNSVSTIHKHLKDLLNDRVIMIDEIGTYKIVEETGLETKKIAVVGTIAAGLPIEAIEDKIAYIQVAGLPVNSDFYACLSLMPKRP